MKLWDEFTYSHLNLVFKLNETSWYIFRAVFTLRPSFRMRDVLKLCLLIAPYPHLHIIHTDMKPLVDPTPEVMLSLHFRFQKLIHFYIVCATLSQVLHYQQPNTSRLIHRLIKKKNNNNNNRVHKHVVPARQEEVSAWNCKLAGSGRSWLYMMSWSPTQ